MRIHNLYVDPEGETHFRDIEVEWSDRLDWGTLSTRLPATGMTFVEGVGGYDLGWHPAPCRQYVILLQGGVEVTASDGERRTIAVGEIVLVEDTTGKGHRSRIFDHNQLRAIFVPVD
jgi:hypothetical protein